MDRRLIGGLLSRSDWVVEYAEHGIDALAAWTDDARPDRPT
jgi:hypothetical protein